MINYDKALDFLKEVEGYKNTYYIPKDSKGNILGHSGVTIGLGIDLGQQDKNVLLKAGVPIEIIGKIEPALGKRGSFAERILNKLQPLTDNEVKLLSKTVIDNSLNIIKRRLGYVYNELPSEVLIVTLSLFHQFGYKLFKYNAFKQIKNKDYKGLIANLRNFGCRYPTRRNKEADLIEQGLML